MRDLLSHMPKPDYALAMAPTEDSLDMFRKFLPEACIFNYFSQEKLTRWSPCRSASWPMASAGTSCSY